MLLDEMHEYNADGFYDRLLCMSAKPNMKVDVVSPMTHFYEDSDSVTIPPSLIDQFNKIGMPYPFSREELKDAMDYYNRICGNTDFNMLRGEKK